MAITDNGTCMHVNTLLRFLTPSSIAGAKPR